MKNNNFNVGDVVQSNYQARWYGVILKLESREAWNGKPIGDLATIHITHTNAGKPQRIKKYIKRMDVAWLEKVGPNSKMYAIVKGLPVEEYNLVDKFDDVINSIKYLYEVIQNTSVSEDFEIAEAKVENKISDFRDLLSQSLK